jgi:hypothetical protein
MDFTPRNIVNVSGDCFDHVRVFSDGMWNVKHGESILQHSLVRFHVQLIVIFLLVNSFHLVLQRFHFTHFTSEILVIYLIALRLHDLKFYLLCIAWH